MYRILLRRASQASPQPTASHRLPQLSTHRSPAKIKNNPPKSIRKFSNFSIKRKRSLISRWIWRPGDAPSSRRRRDRRRRLWQAMDGSDGAGSWRSSRSKGEMPSIEASLGMRLRSRASVFWHWDFRIFGDFFFGWFLAKPH